MTAPGLLAFVAESNAIEGINRNVWPGEIAAHERLLVRSEVEVIDLVGFVEAVAPGTSLRDRAGLDVRVGVHVPPLGSPSIRAELAELLAGIDLMTPYEAHVAYELLHPFTDGNGRSGRALWAWHMQSIGRNPFALSGSFLHRFYYQALEAAR